MCISEDCPRTNLSLLSRKEIQKFGSGPVIGKSAGIFDKTTSPNHTLFQVATYSSFIPYTLMMSDYYHDI